MLANKPHVIAFVNMRDDDRPSASILPCISAGRYGALDEKWAIYPDRASAESAIRHWDDVDSDSGFYFAVPATAIFPDYGKVDPNGPLTAEQRNALFATFGEVFADTNDEARYAFTRLVLGLDPDAPVSWSSAATPRCITAGEASKVLDALNLLNV